MSYALAIVLIILWLRGLVGGATTGGLIDVLLVIAAIVILVKSLSGRKTL